MPLLKAASTASDAREKARSEAKRPAKERHEGIFSLHCHGPFSDVNLPYQLPAFYGCNIVPFSPVGVGIVLTQAAHQVMCFC
jgi:hypothetical protein